MGKQKVLIICGPTATGKTRLALRLASVLNTDIISADSRQIYHGMDLGTGKDIPTGFKPTKQQGFTVYTDKTTSIWGYDLIKPIETYSAAQYGKYASEVISYVQTLGKLPIIVGGTGLYIKNLLHPFATQGVKPNPQLRQQLALLSVNELQDMLSKTAPAKWQQLNHSDRLNPRRLIRALEIAKSQSQPKPSYTPSYNEKILCLDLDTDALKARIEARVIARATSAFTHEIRKLLDMYPDFTRHPSSSAIGYQEWMAYMAGHNTKDVAILNWQNREWQYAKRQRTWFKAQPKIEWLKIGEATEATIVDQIKSWYAI
jgi:tRNA dimethylallyltransferase